MSNYIIDAEGLLCPLPVLKLAKKITQIADGSIVELRATDPMSPIDCEHFCGQKNHQFLSKNTIKEGDIEVFIMKIRVKKT